MRRLTKMMAVIMLLSACGRATRPSETMDEGRALLDDPQHVRYPAGRGDGFNFIVLGGGYGGLVKYAKNEYLRICLQGSLSADQREAWRSSINDVTLKWLSSIRGLTSTPLAKGIVLANNDCHGRVTVSRTSAYTEILDPPHVVMASSGYYGSYNVLLHEFGHAFGLGDTYSNGTSGYCQPGQPQSVMCNTSFKDLQPDDIKGMARVFAKVFPNDKP